MKVAENREVVLFNEQNLDALIYRETEFFEHERGKNIVKLVQDENRKQVVLKILHGPVSKPDSQEYKDEIKSYIREFTLMR